MELIREQGSVVRLVISDPWELAQTIDAPVVALSRFEDGCDVERLLVRPRRILAWSGRRYTGLVLESRTAPGLVTELNSGAEILVNGYGTNQAEDALPPWGLDDWRGGLALIGSARLL